MQGGQLRTFVRMREKVCFRLAEFALYFKHVNRDVRELGNDALESTHFVYSCEYTIKRWLDMSMP
jgi:hypothetical protein